MSERECPECGQPVDEDGLTFIECPGGSGFKCHECQSCECDWSC